MDYLNMYKTMRDQIAREKGAFDQNGIQVVPYEGGAMKGYKENKVESTPVSNKELVNSMYKKAAQELGVTKDWWKDQRVADRAYQLLKEYKQSVKNSVTTPNEFDGPPTKYSYLSSSVRPGELNKELDRYVEYQQPSTVRPGEYNSELDRYVEFVPEAKYTISDFYAKAKNPDVAVSWEFL